MKVYNASRGGLVEPSTVNVTMPDWDSTEVDQVHSLLFTRKRNDLDNDHYRYALCYSCDQGYNKSNAIQQCWHQN